LSGGDSCKILRRQLHVDQLLLLLLQLLLLLLLQLLLLLGHVIGEPEAAGASAVHQS
jgi:hypothetical protein